MPYVLAIYALMSLATFVAYGVDKRRAQSGRWRIRESQLQSLAFCCGFPGALAGRRYFRHKLHKPAFTFVLYAIAFLHVLGWTLWTIR
jgi:uncharacterized membrane protein YsdA (DUF1294 family)